MNDAAASQPSGNGIKENLESSQEHIRAAAEDVRDAAGEAVRDIKDKATQFAGEWKGRMTDVQKDVETYVRENPTKSVLAALGVGFVIGLICRK